MGPLGDIDVKMWWGMWWVCRVRGVYWCGIEISRVFVGENRSGFEIRA